MTDHETSEAGALTSDAILEVLKKLAREELERPAEQVERIGLDTPLVGGLQLDSLAQTVLLAEIQERYDITFGPLDREELESVETVMDLVRFIRAKAERESV